MSISHSSLRDSCDIGFRVQFNAKFPHQVMNFPIEFDNRWKFKELSDPLDKGQVIIYRLDGGIWGISAQDSNI